MDGEARSREARPLQIRICSSQREGERGKGRPTYPTSTKLAGFAAAGQLSAWALLVATTVKSAGLCFRLSVLIVGEGEGKRCEEVTLIIDISGCEGAKLVIQRGVERLRVATGLA